MVTFHWTSLIAIVRTICCSAIPIAISIAMSITIAISIDISIAIVVVQSCISVICRFGIWLTTQHGQLVDFSIFLGFFAVIERIDPLVFLCDTVDVVERGGEFA